MKAGIDQNNLRIENFVDNKVYVLDKYKSLVNSQIHTGNKITYFEIVKLDLMPSTTAYYNDKWGMGITWKDRPNIILDSVATVRIKTSSVFDLLPGIQKNFYQSRSNANFTVTFNGYTNDGEAEIIVRSVSRLVYR